MWQSILFSLSLWTQASAEDANTIMQSIENKQSWTMATQTLSLTITGGKSGKKKQYHMQTQMRKTSDALYCHARFTSPKPVSNTQIVWIDRTEGTDDMWLYLPAIKRVTTLNDNNQSRAFMGSDFEFNDLLLMSLPQTHTMLKENETTWIIESTPAKDAQVPYTKWISTIDKRTNAPVTVALYQQETQLKELTVLEVNADGMPKISRMTNLQTNSSTLLEIHSWDTKTDIPLSHFTKEHLLSSSSTPEPKQ